MQPGTAVWPGYYFNSTQPFYIDLYGTRCQNNKSHFFLKCLSKWRHLMFISWLRALRCFVLHNVLQSRVSLLFTCDIDWLAMKWDFWTGFAEQFWRTLCWRVICRNSELIHSLLFDTFFQCTRQTPGLSGCRDVVCTPASNSKFQLYRIIVWTIIHSDTLKKIAFPF